MAIFLKELKKEPIFTGILLKENSAEARKLLVHYNNSKNTNSVYVNLFSFFYNCGPSLVV